LQTDGKNKSEGLCGVRFWMQVYPKRVPRFEIFEYHGEDLKGVHWFKARKDGMDLGKTMERIAEDTSAGTFKPFLLDMRKMTARIDGE